MATNNPIELLISIKADTEGSKESIQNQLDTLSKSLSGLDVGVKIDQESVNSLKELSKLKFDGVASGIDKVQRSTQEFSKASIREVETAWSTLSRTMQTDFSGAMGVMGDDAKKLKEVLEGMNAVVTTDGKLSEGLAKGEQDVRSLTAAIENDGVKSVIRFNKVLADFGNEAKTFRWMPESIREVDASLKTVYTSTHKFTEQLNKLYRDGKLTEQQFKAMNNEVSKLGKQSSTKGLEDSLTQLNRKTDEYLRINKRSAEEKKIADREAERAQKEQAKNVQRLIKLENDLIAARRKHPTTIGKDSQSDSLEREISRLSNSSKIATDEVTKLENGLRRMKAEATEAGRSSMTIAESFQIAMEKFPVWMAASTAFYGTVRSIRDAFQQIVELDSQMTVLRRVAGDGVDVNKVLAESVELAGKLGNEIADVNEGFIAFARQGFRGDELESMAEYATLLGNISELDVENAASVLTAGLKGFNIEAENAVRIVDALNEVNLVSLLV